jgi:hypothetical protein
MCVRVRVRARVRARARGFFQSTNGNVKNKNAKML